MSTKIATSAGQLQNSYALGKQIAMDAQKKLGKVEPHFVMVFASNPQTHPELLRGVREITGNAPLIGCSTAGEFTDAKHSRDGAVCAIIHSDTHVFSIGMGNELRKNPGAAIHHALGSLPLQPMAGYPYRSAMMLMDGLSGCGEEAVSIAANVLGDSFTLAGGAAGDSIKTPLQRTEIFYNETACTDAVAFCVIHSKQKPKVASSHGHFPSGQPFTITKASGSRVYEINGKNAWEFWKEITRERREALGFTDQSLLDPTRLKVYMLQIQLGISSAPGSYKLRTAFSLYPDGSLDFTCTIPEGSQCRYMVSDKESQLSSVERAAKLAKSGHPMHVAGAIIFDCTCRSDILGDEFYKSVQAFKNTLGNIPLIGFETYGEMSMKPGSPGEFHNTTSVILLLPD